jgi:AICAR transformylase/IMP cyclohydrolase PurH
MGDAVIPAVIPARGELTTANIAIQLKFNTQSNGIVWATDKAIVAIVSNRQRVVILAHRFCPGKKCCGSS